MLELQPFSRESDVEKFKVSSDIQLVSEMEAEVRFVLEGPLSDLLIPRPSPKASFRDFLWEHTCFEVFASPANEEFYWEWNFSPSGDWASYAFQSYRKPRHDWVDAQSYQIDYIVHSSLRAELRAQIHLFESPQNRYSRIDLGFSAVLEDRKKPKSFWALQHVSTKPDFHQRKSFSHSLSL